MISAWADEVVAVAALDPRPVATPAAIAARGWHVSAEFIARIAELAEDDALRLAEIWDEPTEMPDAVPWAARYLAGHIALGHLRPSTAVAIMVEMVMRLGGIAVPVAFLHPGVAGASSEDPDCRGRCGMRMRCVLDGDRERH